MEFAFEKSSNFFSLLLTYSDEPFNGLDKKGVAEVCGILKKYREEGKTVILAAHNFEELGVLCDTVIEMEAGVVTDITEKFQER